MPTLTKGSFTLNLGIVQLTGELSDEDRQCAWELYTELSTRVAVIGKIDDPKCLNFKGELYVDSLNSLYSFFHEARKIMRQFPVGKVGKGNNQHLGITISQILAQVLRPFLEKWHVDFRHWWENESNPRLPPLERQAQYPNLEKFLHDWGAVRWLMRKVQKEIIKVYRLVDVDIKKVKGH